MSIFVAILLASVIFISLWVVEKRSGRQNHAKVMRVLSLIYLAFVFVRCFFLDKFTRLENMTGTIFSPAENSALFALYALYSSLVLVYFGAAFLGSQNFKNISTVFGIPINLLMIVFLMPYLKGATGTAQLGFWNYRVLLLIAETAIGLAIAVSFVASKIAAREPLIQRNQIRGLFLIVPVVLLMFPHSVFSALGGSAGGNLKAFTVFQLYFIIGIAALFIIIYTCLSKRSSEEKYNALILMALALMLQYLKYFTYTPMTLWNTPIHICNFGACLVFFSLLFKNNRALFLFTYYVNVFGTTLAIAYPLIGDDFLSFASINFMFQHGFLLILPILTVLLGVQTRPKRREISKVLLPLVGYYLFSVIIGSIFYVYDTNVNYFYVIQDTVAQVVPFLMPLRNITWAIGKAVFYPVYQLTILAGIVGLLYALDFLYNYIYVFEDFRQEIRRVIAEERDLKRQKSDHSSARQSDYNLEVKGLEKIYPSTHHKALDGISFEVKQGEIVWLIGHNGAGKSTAIKCITGIIPMSHGEVRICGETIGNSDDYKNHIGYAPDNHSEYENLTGYEYINHIGDLYRVDLQQRQKLIPQFLKLFHLEHAAENRISTYSHGMKQKLAILTAMLHEPELLILDEPFSGLDYQTAEELKNIIRLYAGNHKSVLYSSHIFDVNHPLCNRAIILKNGKISRQFTSDEIKNTAELEKEINEIGGEQSNV